MHCIFIILDQAKSFKEKGNKNFKEADYRSAVDNYTEGIKCKSADSELNALLFCNRAAAHFWSGKLMNVVLNVCDIDILRRVKLGPNINRQLHPDHSRS